MTLGVRMLWALSALLPLLAGHESIAQQTIVSDNRSPDTMIVMRRGSCEKRCAVYNIIIFADGSVIYDGRHYVRTTGFVRSKISLEALKLLLDAAQTAGFFELRASDGVSGESCRTEHMDAPSVVLSIASGGQSNTLVHDLRCASSRSARLRQLEEKIDASANTIRWIK